MLKKRSIATMMAAATVATSVAPVFAATIVKETVKKGSDEQKALVNDLRKLLAEGTKYEDGNLKGQSVYEIRTTDATVTSTDVNELRSVTDSVENILQLEKRIDDLAKGDNLHVYVIDKGHAKVNGLINNINASDNPIPAEILAEITVSNAQDANVKEYDVAKFFDGEYVTAEGLDLLTAVRGIEDETKTVTVLGGSDGIVLSSPSAKENLITMTFEVDYVDTAKEKESVTVKITGEDLKHVKSLHDYLVAPETSGAYKIAGQDRFETAVAIANEAYDTTTTSIVLVNATSMIDGLTAAPLASALNAAVLLTNTDELPEATLKYIKSAVEVAKGENDGSKAKVTIVGGTGVVSDKVKSQLQAIGVEVERIGGKDRHATSVEVAVKLEKLAGTKLNKAFLVASTGEADAMSIAPIAAKTKAPIIVEGFDGMSTTANELLKGANDIDVIGGKVSEETQKTYEKRSEYDFVAGEDRFETNAKIIRNYFQDTEENPVTVDTIYVAKDGFTENNNEMLVDALAVGSLAAKEDKVGPIVLASKELTVKQQEAVELVKEDGKTTVTQVGGGLAHNVIKQVAKILVWTK